MRRWKLAIDYTGSVEGIYAFIYCTKWRSGQVLPMPHSQRKDRATQLLIKYKSGALVTQLFVIHPYYQKKVWSFWLVLPLLLVPSCCSHLFLEKGPFSFISSLDSVYFSSYLCDTDFSFLKFYIWKGVKIWFFMNCWWDNYVKKGTN